jgi:PKD repeat protein
MQPMLIKIHVRIIATLLGMLMFSGCVKEPSAFFSLPNQVILGQPFVLSNYSLDASTYLWDFGDGITSTEVSPTHTYVTSGEHNITLTAYNKNGRKKNTSIKTITVNVEGAYVSNYEVSQYCSDGESSYNTSIYSNASVLYIRNFANFGYNFEAYALPNNLQLLIPQQTINGNIFEGSGQLSGDTLSINYSKNGVVNCTAIAIKQHP